MHVLHQLAWLSLGASTCPCWLFCHMGHAINTLLLSDCLQICEIVVLFILVVKVIWCSRCDNITISPALLGELEASKEPLPRKLWPTMGGCDEPQLDMHESNKGLFDKMHGEDQMAVDKLKEGIDGLWHSSVLWRSVVGSLVLHVWCPSCWLIFL